VIINRTWHTDTYDYGADPGGGPRFFLGGAAANKDSAVIVIGGVQVPEGWLLFAQLPMLYVDREPYPEGPPRTITEFLECEGPSDDPVMGVIFNTDCGGWEWDVVSDALSSKEGYVGQVIGPLPVDQAQVQLLRWLLTIPPVHSLQ